MDGSSFGGELVDLVNEIPAEPEIISVIGTIICVIIFYIYLQRLDTRLIVDSSYHDDLTPSQEIKVTTSTLPFFIKFKEQEPASLKDGVHLDVQTTVPCYLQGFWAVDCTSFSGTLRNISRSGGCNIQEKLHGISCWNSDSYVFSGDTCTSKSVHLKIPDEFSNRGKNGSEKETDFDLGPSPRTKYPLIILVGQHYEGSDEFTSHDIFVHTMLWVIHLPDRIVTQHLHVISQMLITSQGLLFDMQKMFMASDETDNLPESQMSASDRDNEHSSESSTVHHHSNDPVGGESDVRRNCIVCQNAPITRAIIPCRHACVCESCLRVLNACPMCRGSIGSHFKLNHSEDTEDDEGLPESVERNSDWKSTLWNVNERLNGWLGFS